MVSRERELLLLSVMSTEDSPASSSSPMQMEGMRLGRAGIRLCMGVPLVATLVDWGVGRRWK